METALKYRSIAAVLRREASGLSLEQMRRVKLAAAERWEALASEIEAIVAPSQVQTGRDWIY